MIKKTRSGKDCRLRITKRVAVLSFQKALRTSHIWNWTSQALREGRKSAARIVQPTAQTFCHYNRTMSSSIEVEDGRDIKVAYNQAAVCFSILHIRKVLPSCSVMKSLCCSNTLCHSFLSCISDNGQNNRRHTQ